MNLKLVMHFIRTLSLVISIHVLPFSGGSVIVRPSNPSLESITPPILPDPRQMISTNPSISTISTGTTLPEPRQIISTDLNTSTVSTGTTSFPSTQTTVGVASIDILRRGSELVADRIVSALGGIATLIDILRNTSADGDVAVTNLGSSTQTLTNRLLTVGMNTASTFLQELNGQLGLSGSGSLVQRLTNLPGNLNLSQGSIFRSTPLQIFFPSTASSNGQNFRIPIVSQILGITDTGLPNISTSQGSNSVTLGSNISSGSASNENVASQVETFLGDIPNPNAEIVDVNI